MQKRILLYSHDTFGLGNIRRNYAVALHLVERLEHSRILLLTSSRSLHLFPRHPRIDYVKLPEIVRVERGRYRSRAAQVDVDALIRLRSEIIRGVSRGFRPTLFLVDKIPLGLEGELAPTLQRLRRRSCRTILLLRDVLDEPGWIRETWTLEGQFDALHEYFRQIWIFGDERVYPTAAAYGLDRVPGVEPRYCGYLRAGSTYRRTQAGDRDKFMVTVGGGEDGDFLLRSVATVAETMPADVSVEVDVLVGPYLPGPERRDLIPRLQSRPGFRCLDYVPDVPDRMRVARGIISMGGYNSVCEVLAARTPALVVPRRWPSREQLIRSKHMGRLGYFLTAQAKKGESSALAHEIREFLLHPRQSDFPRPRMTGLLRAGYLARS